jgi:chromosome segregation ATPase
MSNRLPEQTKMVSMWVSDETKEKVEKAQDPETKERILADYASNTLGLMKSQIEELDDEVARYKGLMAGFKLKFKEVKKAHIDEMYNVWEDAYEEISKLSAKCDKIVNVLDPVEAKLKAINKPLNGINIHRLDKLLETLRSIDSLSNKNKGMIEFLIKHYEE